MKKRPMTREEFINGALSDKGARKSRKVIGKNILLSIGGRRNSRSSHNVNLYLDDSITTDLEKYCSGNKQGILNYLIRRGLDELIEKKEVIIEEMY